MSSFPCPSFPFPHLLTSPSTETPLHLFRFHFSGLVTHLMDLASLARKANTLKSKYNWTDQATTSGGCTCHLDHFPHAIWKTSSRFLYLMKVGWEEHWNISLGISVPARALIFRAMWPLADHFPLWVSLSWSLKRGLDQVTSKSLSHLEILYSLI